MRNDPASPDYNSAESTNEPIDRDNDQYAQDAGSQLGYGEEAADDIEEAQADYEASGGVEDAPEN